MRLIDADAFKEYIRGAYEEVSHMYKDGGKWAKQITEDFCMDIDEQPTIEERKKGKWIIHETENDRYDDMICPFCKKSYTVDAYRIDDIGFTAEDFNFCPNCGARMQGMEGEEHG